jgi:hypothetical protein
MSRYAQHATPYYDLLKELRKREFALREQQMRVDKFVLDLLGSANFATNPTPAQRTKSKVVHGFVLEALNAMPRN